MTKSIAHSVGVTLMICHKKSTVVSVFLVYVKQNEDNKQIHCQQQ